MTLRISQFAALCGIGLLTLSGVVQGQAPRYQSPLSIPQAPEPQLKLPVPAAITPNGTVVEDVVVHVNDQIISRSDVERAAAQLEQEDMQNNASPAETAERQKNFLRDMIDQQLLLSRAKELGLNVDADVIRRLDDIRKQNHMASMDDLERAARQQGVSFEDFKAQIRNSLLVQRVIQEEVGRKMQPPTQAQEQAFYEEHKQEFAQPEQIRLSEILIPVSADAKDDAVAAAQAKANEVEGKIKAGDKFEDLAKTYSGGSTAAQGGDLGTPYKRGAGSLAKVLEDATFPLKAGESTAPIRTRQGFVILKVTDHQQAGIAPLKDVEPQIQQAMYEQQMQPALRKYLTQLREEAAIEIAPGFVDSGASTKQIKTVNTAYTPPVSKKKKKEEKKRFENTRYTALSKTAAKPAVAGAAAAGSTAAHAAAPAPGTAVASNSKPKKIRREKIRFGQAPRTPLPAGPAEAGVSGADTGAGAASAAAAPGTAIAPLESTSQEAANANPLAPVAAPTGKTRFSDRQKEVKAAKAKQKVAAVKEKAAETATPETADEKATSAVQAAPLGLNGDTAKKKKKVKRQKGAVKQRLQNQAPSASAPVEPTPTMAPGRGTPLEGTPAANRPPSSDTTTLPPATAPAPGAAPSSAPQPATPNQPMQPAPPNDAAPPQNN